MIPEMLTMLSMLIGGMALVRVLGIRDWWALPALGFIAGLCLFIAIGTVQAVTPITTSPALTILLTGLVPLSVWIIRLRQEHDISINAHTTLTIVLAFMLAVVFFREADLVNWHVDSFRYIINGSLIANGNYDNASIPLDLATKRMLSVPLIHAPANMVGEWYLRSVTPILSFSVLVSMAWMVWTGLKKRFDARTIVIFTGLGLLLLVTTNRFIFHTFYINGHLLFGALLVLIAGSSWLLAMNKDAPKKALLLLQALAIPALVVTRPEASLVAGLAILPTLLSGMVSFRHKAVLLGTLGLSVIVWQAFVVTVYMDQSSSVHYFAYGLLLVGLAMLLLIPLLRWKWLSKNGRALLWATEGGLWLAALFVGLREPELIVRSLSATFQNVVLGSGSWGASFVILAVLFIGLLALTRTHGQVYLRFAVTTFLPLALLLVFLQEGAYRAGDADSLNRMWMQIIPLAVVYIIAAMIAGEWRRFDTAKLKKRVRALVVGKHPA